MNKKTMYIAAAVIVIVIVVAIAGAYVLMNPGGGGGGTTETVYTMGNATSLQYNVNITTSGVVGTYMFAGKNIGTANLTLRIDATPVVGADTYSSILSATDESAWSNATGTWATSDFATDWGQTWSPLWSGYIDHNPNWKAGDVDITYTDNSGNEIVIYGIVINPTLADSLFTPPT